MQAQKINFNAQRGIALMFTLLAVLVLALVATAILQAQRSAVKAHNQFLDTETELDAVDCCVQAAASDLSVNGITYQQNVVVSIDPTTFISNTFGNTNMAIAKPRISNASKINPQCNLELIRRVQDISNSDVDCDNGCSFIRYFRVTAIQNQPTGRVESQVILRVPE